MHPFPSMEELLQQIEQTSQWFAKLDIRSKQLFSDPIG